MTSLSARCLPPQLTLAATRSARPSPATPNLTCDLLCSVYVPLQERAEVLMSELMGENVGKSAEQAGELFVRCPALANTRHIMPSIARVVAAQHGDD